MLGSLNSGWLGKPDDQRGGQDRTSRMEPQEIGGKLIGTSQLRTVIRKAFQEWA